MANENDITDFCYTSDGVDPDTQNVFRNKLNLRSGKALAIAERQAVRHRMDEVREGKTLPAAFDRTGLSDLHRHLFQDIYEWAGTMRDEIATVGGKPTTASTELETARPNNARSDLHLAITDALRPVNKLSARSHLSEDEFCLEAGNAFVDIMVAHPFVAGDADVAKALMLLRGQRFNHAVDIDLVTDTRIARTVSDSAANPDSPHARHLIEDITQAGRKAGLRAALFELSDRKIDVSEVAVRTARADEIVDGHIAARDENFAFIETADEIVVVDRDDLPRRLPVNSQPITVKARSKFDSAGEVNTEAAADLDLDPVIVAAIAKMSAELKTERVQVEKFTIRTARQKENVNGHVLLQLALLTSIIDTNEDITIVPTIDLPAIDPRGDGQVRLEVLSPIPDIRRESQIERAPVSRLLEQEKLAETFLTLDLSKPQSIPELEQSLRAYRSLQFDVDNNFDEDDPSRAEIMKVGREMIADDIKNGRSHSRRLAESAIERCGGYDRGYER